MLLFLLLTTGISTLLVVIVPDQAGWEELIFIPETTLNGEAYFRAWQNRLLAPLLWYFFIYLGFKSSQVFISLIFCGLFLNYYLIFLFAKNIKNNNIFSGLMVLAWAILFQLLNQGWIMLWDITDILIFTIVSYIMVFSLRYYQLLFLYPIALLNRESALFIPIAYWLSWFYEIRITEKPSWHVLINRKSILTYSLIILGMAYTKAIRDFLFVKPYIGSESWSQSVTGNHFYLPGNLKNLFYYNFVNERILLSSLIIVIFFFLIFIFFKKFIKSYRPLILLVLIYFSSIFIFGNMKETRMYYPLVTPLVFLFGVTINNYFDVFKEKS